MSHHSSPIGGVRSGGSGSPSRVHTTLLCPPQSTRQRSEFLLQSLWNIKKKTPCFSGLVKTVLLGSKERVSLKQTRTPLIRSGIFKHRFPFIFLISLLPDTLSKHLKFPLPPFQISPKTYFCSLGRTDCLFLSMMLLITQINLVSQAFFLPDTHPTPPASAWGAGMAADTAGRHPPPLLRKEGMGLEEEDSAHSLFGILFYHFYKQFEKDFQQN